MESEQSSYTNAYSTDDNKKERQKFGMIGRSLKNIKNNFAYDVHTNETSVLSNQVLLESAYIKYDIGYDGCVSNEHYLESSGESKNIFVDDLKRPAMYYAHSELVLTAADVKEAHYRVQILADTSSLKKLAIDYAHPEHSVTVTDATVFGRNYFSRPSTPVEIYMNEDEAQERIQILNDASAFKKLAMDYAHPQHSVTMADVTLFGRNYFSRPSAPSEEDMDDTHERTPILADASTLKKLAMDYAHPQHSVTATDSTIIGRNYFSRLSAPGELHINEDETQERTRIIVDASTLKKLAIDYAHPEHSVTVAYFTLFGRNYFSRISAPSEICIDEAHERAQVLSDALTLKKLAMDYAHPQHSVTATDVTVFGRNYFSRPSALADKHTNEDETQEHSQILFEASVLEKRVMDCARLEHSMNSTDTTLFGRNHILTPSATSKEYTYEDDSQDRAHILADALDLKKLAMHYTHPEFGVIVTDATVFGRNYFSRYSAPSEDHVDTDETKKCAQDLAYASALERLAMDDAHPDLDVALTSSIVIERNHLSRPSALSHDSFDDHLQSSTKHIPMKGSLDRIEGMAIKHCNYFNKDDSDSGNIYHSLSSVALFGLDDSLNSEL